MVPNLSPFGAGRSIWSFYISYRGARVPRRDAAAGCSPRPWVAITRPLGRRGPRVASVPSIWSEPLHAMWRAERHGRAKRASSSISSSYMTRSTSVFSRARKA